MYLRHESRIAGFVVVGAEHRSHADPLAGREDSPQAAGRDDDVGIDEHEEAAGGRAGAEVARRGRAGLTRGRDDARAVRERERPAVLDGAVTHDHELHVRRTSVERGETSRQDLQIAVERNDDGAAYGPHLNGRGPHRIGWR